jgi:hypothetical protein
MRSPLDIREHGPAFAVLVFLPDELPKGDRLELDVRTESIVGKLQELFEMPDEMSRPAWAIGLIMRAIGLIMGDRADNAASVHSPHLATPPSGGEACHV